MINRKRLVGIAAATALTAAALALTTSPANADKTGYPGSGGFAPTEHTGSPGTGGFAPAERGGSPGGGTFAPTEHTGSPGGGG